MLIVLGLNAANAHYACPICEVHSNDRWDTSVDAGRYNGDNVRKLSVMKEQAALKATKRNVDRKKGCINMPLVDIEPCDCVIDELHLFLRITDKLFDSFFAKMVALDHAYKVHKTGVDGNVSNAVAHIRALGVSFSVWTKTDARNSSTLEMTTLNRNERRKVLRGLPVTFDELLPPELSARLAKLWLVNYLFTIMMLLLKWNFLGIC